MSESTIPKSPLKPTTVKRVSQTFIPYKAQVVGIVIMVIASVIVGLLPAWFIKVIIDKGITPGNLHITALYSVWTLVVTIAASLLTFAYGYLSVLVGQRIMRDLRNQLFRHLQGMSLRFFTGARTGDIQTRLISDVGGVQTVVSDVVANALSNIGVVVASLVAMFWLDWRLTLLSVGLIPIFALISAKAGGIARKIRKGVQEQTSEMNSLMQETLSVSGVLLIKTSGRRVLVEDKFATENQKLSDRQVQNQMIQYFFFGMFRLIFSAVPAVIYWFAGYLIYRGNPISLGTLVAFTSLQARMFFPLSALLSVQVEMMGAMALFDRIFEYLDTPQDIKDADDAIDLPIRKVAGDITFEDVSFSYSLDGTDHAISHVSFEVLPGRLTALVGPSGAGKTTLTYLLARLYDVNDGAVKIDGVDVRKIKQSSLEEIIGAVTQETYLVHASIKDNLRFANPNATHEEIVEACRFAAIDDHIQALPEGYDTLVGERGYKLSGGEKQRIALARAILKNPKILILDEATSALDTQSERQIQASLNKLMEGRTTIAIAHRLSTILSADQILVVQGGKVVERGRHEELLAMNGLYTRLYEEQFRNAPTAIAGA